MPKLKPDETAPIPDIEDLHVEYSKALKLRAGFSYFTDGTASRSAWGDSPELAFEIRRKMSITLLVVGSKLAIVALILASII